VEISHDGFLRAATPRICPEKIERYRVRRATFD
jgi:hypothetical protein